MSNFNRSATHPSRGARLQRPVVNDNKLRGYGLAIDFIDGRMHDARLVDRSPALFVEKVEKSGFEENGHRRICLAEYFGDGNPPASGIVRHVVDAFFTDRRVAEFVWMAVIEKIENDAQTRTKMAA